MQLLALAFSNLYSYGDKAVLQLSDKMTLLVGPNNAGKSNILRIIRLLIESLRENRNLKGDEINDIHQTPLLVAKLKLSNDETELLLDFLGFYRYYRESGHQENGFYEFKNRSIIADNLSEITISLSWDAYYAFTGERSVNDVSMTFDKIGAELHGRTIFSGLDMQNVIRTKNGEQDFRQFLDSGVCDKNDPSSVIKSGEGNLTVVTGFSVNELQQSAFQSIEKTRLRRLLVLLGKDYTRSQRSLYLLPLIGEIMNRSIQFASDERALFKQEQPRQDYFLNEGFPGIPDTLAEDGSNLAHFLYGLMHSNDYENRKRYEEIKSAFKELTQKQDFDVVIQSKERTYTVHKGEDTLSSDTVVKNYPVIIVHRENGKGQIPLERSSSGLAETLFLLTVAYGLKNRVILLDEPTSNLHPPLMKSLMSRIIKNHDASGLNQFVVVTHSPELAHFGLFEADGDLSYIRRNSQIGNSTIKPLDKDTKDWFRDKKSVLSYQIDTRLLFGKHVILVEGDSDKKVLFGLATIKSKDFRLDDNDIIVIVADGKPNFPKYKRLLDALEIPYNIIADYDARMDGNSNLSEIFASCSFITKEGINGDNNTIFIIKDRDLEGLMREIDPIEFSKTRDELLKVYGHEPPKPLLAEKFVGRMTQHDVRKLKPFTDLLDRIHTQIKG